jgi:hypothetical protein
MKKADLLNNHRSLDEAITRYRTFLEKIVRAQRVVSTAAEKRDLAESTILRVCAHWERFVDEHLVDCVNVDHTKLNEYFDLRIPSNPSKDLCQALVIGVGYTDFRSVGDLKGQSRKLLPEASNPFLAITRAHSDKIDEAYTIRNYLSHYSAKSGKNLMRMYDTTYRMARFVEPGRFLLGYNAQRLWAYLEAFEGASTDMEATYPRH